MCRSLPSFYIAKDGLHTSMGIFVTNPDHLVRILIIGTLAYITLVALLRISGKRTLTKLNSFDFVVTVALGSTLATILLNKQVSLFEGVTALALLILLQYLITWTSRRSSLVHHLTKSTPKLVVHKGKFLEENMRQERLTQEEVLQSARNSGVQELSQVYAVILESDGSLSFLKDHVNPDDPIFQTVKQ